MIEHTHTKQVFSLFSIFNWLSQDSPGIPAVTNNIPPAPSNECGLKVHGDIWFSTRGPVGRYWHCVSPSGAQGRGLCCPGVAAPGFGVHLSIQEGSEAQADCAAHISWAGVGHVVAQLQNTFARCGDKSRMRQVGRCVMSRGVFHNCYRGAL